MVFVDRNLLAVFFGSQPVRERHSQPGHFCHSGTANPGTQIDFKENNPVDLAAWNFVLFNWNQPASNLPSQWTSTPAGDNVNLQGLNQVLFK